MQSTCHKIVIDFCKNNPCFNSIKIKEIYDASTSAFLPTLDLFRAWSILDSQCKTDYYFNRVATFGVCTHIDQTCNNDTETAAEIVYVDKLGKTLVYTNSLNKELGIVDIQDLKIPSL